MFRTEAFELERMEKSMGYTWNDLHSYKSRYNYPKVPMNFQPPKILDCANYYDKIDKCVLRGQEEEDTFNPYKRLTSCKPYHHRFNRCVDSRDHHILKAVKHWEKDQLAAMDTRNQEVYLRNLEKEAEMLYQQAKHEPTLERKDRLQRDLIYLEQRLRHLKG